MTDLLQELREKELIADIDWHFARLIAKFDRNERPEVALAAALASVRTRGGHVCLDLEECAGRPLETVLGDTGPGEREVPSRTVATARSLAGRLARKPRSSPGRTAKDQRPLVLDARGRLYLARYRNAERSVAEALLAMAESAESVANADAKLDDLFQAEDRDQRRAAEAVLRHRLCVVTGGPGTGKTYLAARLIALFLDLGIAKQDRIALAAPTGKAAARLQESVAGQIEELARTVRALEGYVANATTVHRLLYRARSGAGLPVDAVVLDEASMVDLALMSRLVGVLPDHARLVVLGDAHQLSSVQPGAVLGDLCAVGNSSDSPLQGCVVD